MKIANCMLLLAAGLGLAALAARPALAGAATGADARLSGVVRRVVDEDRTHGQAAAEALAAAHGLRVRGHLVSVMLDTSAVVSDATVLAAGGQVTGRAGGRVRVDVPSSRIAALAALLGVRLVREPRRPHAVTIDG